MSFQNIERALDFLFVGADQSRQFVNLKLACFGHRSYAFAHFLQDKDLILDVNTLR